MPLPEFDYATMEFINTWQYADMPEQYGSMGIARLHSRNAKDVYVPLFTRELRHQNTFENLFATKAKFRFTVNRPGQMPSANVVEEVANQFRSQTGSASCGADLVEAQSPRAIFYPVCP